jgi:transcription antitermination factor NusG
MQALEAKLAAAEQATFVRDNTVRLLEEQLKEKEGQVNKLQQDKNKLEVAIGFSWHLR